MYGSSLTDIGCADTNGQCGIYKSADGGQSWTGLNIPESVVQNVAFDVTPGVVYAAAYDGLEDANVYTSADDPNLLCRKKRRAHPIPVGGLTETAWAVGLFASTGATKSTEVVDYEGPFSNMFLSCRAVCGGTARRGSIHSHEGRSEHIAPHNNGGETKKRAV